MLGRRRKAPVLAEIPPRTGDDGARGRGAIGRAELEALSGLADSLSGAGSVFVTGPSRSTVALGLSAVAAARGMRVALLECDLAEPWLAEALGLERAPGLREHLLEEVEAAEILQPLMLAGPASGGASEPLVCVVAGAPQSQPVRLLDSERCDKAIQELSRAYDLLVIDGPGLDEDAHSLQALSEHAGATIVCGPRKTVPRTLPFKASGLVVTA